MAKASSAQFIEFRTKKLALLNSGKITPDDFHDYIHGFLIKTKIKPVIKIKNRQQAIQSYYYWTSFIERKIIIEQKLAHFDIGSVELLRESIRLLVKRKEKTILFILNEIKEKAVSIEKISEKSAIITLKDGTELICSVKTLSDLNVNDIIVPSKQIQSRYSRFFISFLENL